MPRVGKWAMSRSDRPASDGDSCEGCGSLLDLSDQEITQAVEDVLESTQRETAEFPGVCPLCGRSSRVPVSHRKSVQFGLLALALIVVSVVAVDYYLSRDTERQEALRQALDRLGADPGVTRHLGVPVESVGSITGGVRSDETGWQEVKLKVPVRGPLAEGVLEAVGGRQAGTWTFTTLEVTMPAQKRRLDAVTHRVVEQDPASFTEIHTQGAAAPDYAVRALPLPSFDGDFPCIASISAGPVRLDRCAMALPGWGSGDGPGLRFEVDLRFGRFILRSADVALADRQTPVRLVRTYSSQFEIHPSRSHAFGRHSSHNFDVAPVGSRNPYRDIFLVLPDGDFLHWPRISKGTGYADAVYRHSETSSRFYKATMRWDGHGWDVRLDDGSAMHFPESYNGSTLAHGAATEMTDAAGRTLHMVRDPQRNLREIRIAGGGSIHLTLDALGRVVRAVDDRERWVAYRYDGTGLLAEVTRADGGAWRYGYVGDQMISIEDAAGRLLLRNHYRGPTIVRQEHAAGGVYEFEYRMAANQRYAEEVVVTFPDGSRHGVRTGDSVPKVLRDLAR